MVKEKKRNIMQLVGKIVMAKGVDTQNGLFSCEKLPVGCPLAIHEDFLQNGNYDEILETYDPPTDATRYKILIYMLYGSKYDPDIVYGQLLPAEKEAIMPKEVTVPIEVYTELSGRLRWEDIDLYLGNTAGQLLRIFNDDYTRINIRALKKAIFPDIIDEDLLSKEEMKLIQSYRRCDADGKTCIKEIAKLQEKRSNKGKSCAITGQHPSSEEITTSLTGVVQPHKS